MQQLSEEMEEQIKEDQRKTFEKEGDEGCELETMDIGTVHYRSEVGSIPWDDPY